MIIRLYRGFFGTNGFFDSPELYKIFILYNIFGFFRDGFLMGLGLGMFSFERLASCSPLIFNDYCHS